MWRRERESAAFNNDLHIISHKSRHESQTWIDVINIEYINNTWDCEYVRWVLVGEIVLLMYYCAFCSTISRWTNDDHYKCMHFCSVGLKNLGFFCLFVWVQEKKSILNNWESGEGGVFCSCFKLIEVPFSSFIFTSQWFQKVQASQISLKSGHSSFFLFFVLFLIDIYFCIILGSS